MDLTFVSSLWADYFAQFEKIFSITTNKKVLDLGCAECQFWPYIQKYSPTSIEGVDPDQRWVPVVSDPVIYRQNYEDFLPRRGYDVILCFGLEYKLSDPIGMIERLVASEPEFILFETLTGWNNIHKSEVILHKGSTYIELGDLLVNNPVKLPWAILLSPLAYSEAFSVLGYKLVTQVTTNTPGLAPKKKTCIMVFRRDNQEPV